MKPFIEKIYRLFIRVATCLQCPLLLAMRLYWGWSFFQTGLGKIVNLDRTTGFFQSLHIPMPQLNAVLAGSTEYVGGFLLMIGYRARLASVPLIFTMIIAYVTADSEAVHAIFSDPDKFVSAAPFQFLLTALIVLAFGPGRISLDWLIGWKFGSKDDSCTNSPSPVRK